MFFFLSNEFLGQCIHDIEKTSVLVGNGINRLEINNNISWENLLERIKNALNMPEIDIENPFKPLPLTFEQIIFNTQGSFDENVRSIKNNIAINLFKVKPNRIHKILMESKNIGNILTTNYDYAFEKVFEEEFPDNGKLFYRTTESKHSVKRRYYMQKKGLRKSVWHIHGEISHKKKYPAESILIGFDHYVRYTNKIAEYLSGNKQIKSISEKMKTKESGNSWIDIFFFGKLVIFGLTLDFSEIDIWWLLNYRKKFFVSNKTFKPNEIIYYQPVIKANNNNNDKNKAKEDMLSALGVKYEEIICNSYEEFYDKVIKKENF